MTRPKIIFGASLYTGFNKGYRAFTDRGVMDGFMAVVQHRYLRLGWLELWVSWARLTGEPAPRPVPPPAANRAARRAAAKAVREAK